MFSSSFKSTVVWISAFALVSCAPQHVPQVPQLVLTGPNASLYASLQPNSAGSENYLQTVYRNSPETACQWLSQIRNAQPAENRFRLMGRFAVNITDSWLNDLANGRTIDDVSTVGKVDMAASPLYHYALLGQQFPNKDQFLALIDKQIHDTPLELPILLTVKLILQSEISNPYNERNKIIQQKIEQSLPGAFTLGGDLSSLKGTLPAALIKNGSHQISLIKPVSGDLAPVSLNKAKSLTTLLNTYSRALPVFTSSDWATFRSEMEEGMNAAIVSFNSTDPLEQACGAVILHRNLAQLLAISGQDRLPMIESTQDLDSALPAFDQMLDIYTGTTLRVCPTAGSFSLNGQRAVLRADTLAGFDSTQTEYELADEPLFSESCTLDKSVPLDSKEYSNFPQAALVSHAGAGEWVEMIAGLVHFMVAFNPAATWWATAPGGYPMAEFTTLDDIQSTGAVLPSDAHALSLALARISAATLLNEHIVMVNTDLKEESNADNVTGIRISEGSRNAGDAGIIETRLTTTLRLMEIGLKLAASFDELSQWKTKTEKTLAAQIATTSDSVAKLKLQAKYNTFVDGLFGSIDNLNLLVATGTDNTGKESLRDQLEELKAATAILMATFSQLGPDGKNTCVTTLQLDLSTGIEKKLGQCTLDEEDAWKTDLNLIAQVFQSPLFEELSH